MNIRKITEKYKDYIIEKRRYFHMHPESSNNEFNTSKVVQQELDKLGIPYEIVAKTGIIARIKGGKPGKTVLLRADMDALEVCEKNDVPYKSQNEGRMHACGHDGHTAMLLGAAHVLNEVKDELNGTVVLLFQKAEEIGTGAKEMIDESGILKEVDAVFGIHLWQGVEVGKVSLEAGPRMAAADHFLIRIKGRSGHGSMPQDTIDAAVVASSIVMNLQHLVSRNTDPLDTLVITVGKIDVGTRFNIIPGEGLIEGTSRSFDEKIWEDIPNKLERVVNGVCATYGATGSVEMRRVVPPLSNNPEISKILYDAQAKLYGEDSIVKYEKTTGGEDFAYFTRALPGALAFVGIRNDAKGINAPHHNEHFNMDEDALPIGASLYAQFAIDYLEKTDKTP
ncbi:MULTISPECIES: amidohydrolase [unclassified Fusobacterium]|uniref:amidohydrolase n=1 Tax=unclassified Fusobacterium TaxID=2648384 RepID=UPI001B8BD7E4|nr:MULTISPECIES: amidohydrolase [unclassified Fusobacterium]MBR8701398.1 N-acetyldiaminopimelate deacetylase [Fusobacterium sp. DD45]MBR8711166.1 N-acetyldiaminopimelate deacetylase [Fusobacterium sp. DD28]MBR8751715.1 N-acetyldiaminopimelate deacetylase [Fusobacterium sp. DD26]